MCVCKPTNPLNPFFTNWFIPITPPINLTFFNLGGFRPRLPSVSINHGWNWLMPFRHWNIINSRLWWNPRAPHSSWGVASTAIASTMREILETGIIPENFKCGLITPVFNGHGCDPTLTDCYRNISVLTVLCKLFEKLIVGRLSEVRVAAPVSRWSFILW